MPVWEGRGLWAAPNGLFPISPLWGGSEIRVRWPSDQHSLRLRLPCVGSNAYLKHPWYVPRTAAPTPIVPVRYVLAALAAVAVALVAAAPVGAQPSRKPAPDQPVRTLVGLPLFSSDGKRVGRIIAAGTDDDNQAVLVAEIERPLGIGSDAVAIPFDMFVRKAGRVELTITAAEVAERISGAQPQR